MTFDEALHVLNIVDYRERIINSHSRGELFHLAQYIHIAECMKDDLPEFKKLFSTWFRFIVEDAEKNWDRPESVFQHVSKLLQMLEPNKDNLIDKE